MFSVVSSVIVRPLPIPVGIRNYDVALDGSRFVMVERGPTEEFEFHVVLNWHRELETRLGSR